MENKDVYPYDYKPCGCECFRKERVAPSTDLLAVNRQINMEATPLLYSGVTFHVETGYGFMRFISPSKHICMFSHPSEEKLHPSRHLIRSLSFEFLPEILERGPQASRMMEFWKDESFRALSTRQRAGAIHEYTKTLCKTVWEQAGHVIVHMRGLQNLELDIGKVFCPQGCCRMVGHVVRCLKGLKKKKDLKLTVAGNMREWEVSRVIDGLKYDAAWNNSSSWKIYDDDVDDDDGEDYDGDSDEDDDDGNYGDSEDDIPTLSDISDVDTDIADSSSEISDASTISLPANLFDTTSTPGSSSNIENDLAT